MTTTSTANLAATQPNEVEAIEFCKESYELISDFHCGDSDYAKLCEDWLKGTPPDFCAFRSIEMHGTQVWIFRHCGEVIGFGSVGPNKHNGERIAFIPMLAVAADFQGKSIGGTKASHVILDFLIGQACEISESLVCLWVAPDNSAALRLYRDYGFRDFKHRDKYGNIRLCKVLAGR